MKRKIDWKKVIDVHIWAIKQWWKIDPKLFFSTGLYAIANAVAPYVTVWFSARIINELAGNRDADTLWKWVILTVCVTAGMKFLTEALYHWKELVHAMEGDLIPFIQIIVEYPQNQTQFFLRIVNQSGQLIPFRAGQAGAQQLIQFLFHHAGAGVEHM